MITEPGYRQFTAREIEALNWARSRQEIFRVTANGKEYVIWNTGEIEGFEHPAYIHNKFPAVINGLIARLLQEPQ